MHNYTSKQNKVIANAACIIIKFRVSTHPGKFWKVMELEYNFFQAWKVMEMRVGHENSWKSHGIKQGSHGQFLQFKKKYMFN